MKLRFPRFAGAENDAREMSFADHLRELRYRVIVCCIAVAVFLVPAWFLYSPMMEFLNEPYCSALLEANPAGNCDFLVTNPLVPFSLRMKVAGYGAFFLAIPVILWQLWRFIAPGMYKKERRYAMAFSLSAVVLFGLGMFISYITLNQAVNFLVRVGGDTIDFRSGPGEFVQLALFMMMAFGLGFQIPVLLVSLQMIGVLKPDQLSKYRRHTIVGIVVLAAGITPSGDPISLAALSIPMYFFFEISVIIGRIYNRQKQKKLANMAATHD